MLVARRIAKESPAAQRNSTRIPFSQTPSKHQKKAPTFVSMIGAFFRPPNKHQKRHRHSLRFGASFVSIAWHCSVAFVWCEFRFKFAALRNRVLCGPSLVSMLLHYSPLRFVQREFRFHVVERVCCVLLQRHCNEHHCLTKHNQTMQRNCKETRAEQNATKSCNDIERKPEPSKRNITMQPYLFVFHPIRL